MPGIRDRAWELGWKTALKKVGVSGGHPLFRNPPKFPSSDFDLHSIIDSPLILSSSQVPFAASAEVFAVVPPNPEAPPEAPPVGDVVPEAPHVTLEAVPEASVVMSEAPPEIDCNVDAAIL